MIDPMTHTSHTADALVLTCMDYRLHTSQLADFLRSQGVERWDLRTQQGCSKDLCLGADAGQRQSMIDAVRIAVELHGVQRVFLMNHTDCGAYGGAKAFPSKDAEHEHHAQDLRRARQEILTKFLHLDVQAILISIEDETNAPRLVFQKVV